LDFITDFFADLFTVLVSPAGVTVVDSDLFSEFMSAAKKFFIHD